MSEVNESVKVKPVFNADGVLTGWRVLYLADTPGLFSSRPHSRFFPEVIAGEGYLQACKFRESLLRPNENHK